MYVLRISAIITGMDDATKHILEIITDIQEQMVTKDDLQSMATKDDLRNLATKDGLEEMHRELQLQITENTKAITGLSEWNAYLRLRNA